MTRLSAPVGPHRVVELLHAGGLVSVARVAAGEPHVPAHVVRFVVELEQHATVARVTSSPPRPERDRVDIQASSADSRSSADTRPACPRPTSAGRGSRPCPPLRPTAPPVDRAARNPDREGENAASQKSWLSGTRTDVGLPRGHPSEVGGEQPFAAARPFERRARDPVKQVRAAIGGAHGIAVHVVAARGDRPVGAAAQPVRPVAVGRAGRGSTAGIAVIAMASGPGTTPAGSRRHFRSGCVEELHVLHAEVVVEDTTPGSICGKSSMCAMRFVSKDSAGSPQFGCRNEVEERRNAREASMTVSVVPLPRCPSGRMPPRRGSQERRQSAR